VVLGDFAVAPIHRGWRVFDRVGSELGELFAKLRFASCGDHWFAWDAGQAIVSAYDVLLGAVF
jgi:hypothetical protein